MRQLFLFTAALALARFCAAAADFTVSSADLKQPVRFVAYGDTRFTDPQETNASNPGARRALVNEIARLQPSAIFMSGDLPWHGANVNDYAQYQTETQVWKASSLRVYPALGNHELNGSEAAGLQNWWAAFPALSGKRWYSVQLGDDVLAINVDSNSDLTPGSPQAKWLTAQLRSAPASNRWILLNLHHPPFSDFQNDGDDSHNVRPNEGALATFLEAQQSLSRAQFVVLAGHVHNYERFIHKGVYYFVSGGGGAKPRPVIRTSQDLYRSTEFPNYHFLYFVVDGKQLQGTMIRLADPDAVSPRFDERDHFSISPRQ